MGEFCWRRRSGRSGRTTEPLPDVVVEPLQYLPTLLLYQDIGETPNIFPNSSVEDYYNKASVRTYTLEEMAARRENANGN